MTLIVGPKQGLVVGPLAGLNSRWPVASIGDGLAGITSGADLRTLMNTGAAGAPLCVNLWKGNETSGTTTTDLQGSDNLTDAGTPTRDHTNSDFNEQTIAFDYNSTDALAAAASGVCNPSGTTPFALWYASSIGYTAPRMLVGKRDTASPNYGWEIQAQSGPGVRFIHDTPLGSTTKTVNGSSALITVGVVCDPGGNRLDMYTSQGNSTGGANNDSAGNTSVFAVGQQRLNANQQDFGAFAWWSGSSSADLLEAHFDACQTHLGA